MNAINFADFLQIDPNSKQLWHFALFGFALLVLYRMITGGDFAAKVLGVCVILFGLWFLAGCTDGPTNPLGMTDRTRLRTDASVSIAQADSAARIAQAQADEAARIAASNASIITEQSRQNGETARAHTWAGVIPLALLIVGGTVVLALVCNWQGRIYYARATTGPTLTMHQAPALDTAKLRMLESYTRQRNMELIQRDGQYFLTDGQHTIKALERIEPK